MHARSRFCAAVVLLATTACGGSTGPDSFIGLWRGSNAVFDQFQLNFQTQSDTTAWGSAFFHFADPPQTVADTDFVARVAGDNLVFVKQAPPSVGLFVVTFQGQRSGDTITGVANGAPIHLTRRCC